jgi:hypothetical protein
VRAQIQRSFVGLAGESRNFDANTPVFHIQGVNPFNLATGKIEPAAPLDANTPRRTGRTCRARRRIRRTCNAPGGDATLYGGGP